MGKSIRLGFIGLSKRGSGLLGLLLNMPDVDVPAVCDRYEDRVQAAVEKVKEAKGYEATGYLDYRELLEREDIEAVIIATSWQTHIKIAVHAMRAGKRPAMEVGGANNLDECWRLVRTSEETGIPCMMLENCCYGKEELTLLKMVKDGLFGELVHMEGAYGHDLRREVVEGLDRRHYRLRHFQHRNAELYPTHELGPIANMLSINRGNRMVSLVSMSSKARGLHDWAVAHRGADSYEAGIVWNEGDVVTTLIKCANGETIKLQHDNSLPRKYSRELRLHGTKGVYMETGDLLYLEGISDPEKGELEWDKFHDVIQDYVHPLWKWYENEGVKSGHGGIDYLVLRAFVESVRDGSNPPIDVYDCAAWMCITCLSEDSIALGSAPVAIPDFTSGLWIDRAPDPKSRYSLDAIHEDLF